MAEEAERDDYPELTEALKLRENPAVRALMPFLTASDTGHPEYDGAPFPEQQAAYVLRLLSAIDDCSGRVSDPDA